MDRSFHLSPYLFVAFLWYASLPGEARAAHLHSLSLFFCSPVKNPNATWKIAYGIRAERIACSEPGCESSLWPNAYRRASGDAYGLGAVCHCTPQTRKCPIPLEAAGGTGLLYGASSGGDVHAASGRPTVLTACTTARTTNPCGAGPHLLRPLSLSLPP